MRNILLTVQYDGTNYSGWQKQEGQITIQQTIEVALKEICGHEIELFASGRTDAGVHAYAQMANFTCECNIPSEKIAYAVNSKLPDDIKVIKSEEVNLGFHARFNAKRKTYLYKLYFSPQPLPLKERNYVRIQYDLDLNQIKRSARYFIGTHDFATFTTAVDMREKETTRTIYSVKIVKKPDNEVFIYVTGNGFLHNMVRIIVGTLLEVGRGKIRSRQIKQIIELKNRKSAGATAPAKGLHLLKVYY
ncbi:MAG: tRNA pseudouridine(38-40) synthase TruA [Clostridia bacterium]|jgi:tRNA pseudouridine38-40 synthase|nr:tRNA pseudouridine(38-40) synthase TruA [Clostridia bacterium]MDD4276014.1 tRNA pseudouridine(38-40) synthase TruA [Clostridia bacterium]